MQASEIRRRTPHAKSSRLEFPRVRLPYALLLVIFAVLLSASPASAQYVKENEPLCPGPDCQIAALRDGSDSCPSGQVKCGRGNCVDVTTNRRNCGRCGNVCGKGQTCTNGTCSGEAGSCATGQTKCPGGCADLATNRRNCGQCGNVCGKGQTCTNGQCSGGAASCATGQVKCPGGCVDVTTNRRNCGQCGNACGKGQTCTNGTCSGEARSCTTGQTKCPSGCVDTTANRRNCGQCGNVCAKGEMCTNGACSRATSVPRHQ